MNMGTRLKFLREEKRREEKRREEKRREEKRREDDTFCQKSVPFSKSRLAKPSFCRLIEILGKKGVQYV